MGARCECGVAAVSSNVNNGLVYSLYKMLLSMQNRGQLSAGITTFNPKRSELLDTHKGLGLVNEVFNNRIKNIIDEYQGTAGIGQVRYATLGTDDAGLAQPFERHHGRLWKWYSFCFNGNITNYPELKSSLIDDGYHIVRESDTEVMMHHISKQLRNATFPNLAEKFSNLADIFDGAYNIAFLDATGRMAVVRDPLGIRPLVWGRKNGSTYAASETNALAACGVYDTQDLPPGHMLLIKNGRADVVKYHDSPRRAHCMFEWVYFANVSSTMEGRSVYNVRRELGKQLALNETLDIDSNTIIVPVPETSTTSCDAMAYELGIPKEDGLIRNRYLGRTFIDSANRAEKVRNKFTVLEEVIRGKKVLLVDDSIVRGTTSKELVNYVREVGRAKEVHMRSACPPIISPCFYGIDMSTVGELFAGGNGSYIAPNTLQEMAEKQGAESLVYQSIDGLVKSIGLPKDDLCLACLDSNYPTVFGEKLYEVAKENFKCGKEGRTYEC